MEQEIDLGKTIEILLRRWYYLAIPTIVCGLLVGGYLSFQPTVYQAQALVVPTQLSTLVSFGTAIQTASENASLTRADIDQRLASYAGLVTSPAIAEIVLAQVADRLPPDNRSVDALTAMISGEVLPESDLIEITVTHQDRGIALDVAVLWSTEYVNQVNAFFGELAAEPYANIRREAEIASKTYAQQQVALEEAIRQDNSKELRRQIEELDAILEATSRAQGSTMDELLTAIQRVRRLRDSAQDMYDQLLLSEEPVEASTALALAALKLQVLDALPSRLALSEYAVPAVDEEGAASPFLAPIRQSPAYSLQMPSDGLAASRAALVDDLEGLVQVLDARRVSLEEQLGSFLMALQSGSPWTLSENGQGPADRHSAIARIEMERQVRELLSELEQQQGLLKQKTAQRDVSWEAYNNLIRKETELQLSLATASKDVRLGAPTTVAARSRNLARNTAMAAIVGGILGLIGIFVAEVWRRHNEETAASPLSDDDSRA